MNRRKTGGKTRPAPVGSPDENGPRSGSDSAVGASSAQRVHTKGTITSGARDSGPPDAHPDDAGEPIRAGRGGNPLWTDWRAVRTVCQSRSVKLCSCSARRDVPMVKLTRRGHETERQTMGVQGVKRCGSRWLCPLCGVRLAAKSLDTLTRYQSRAAADGSTVLATTFTVGHDLSMSWAEVHAQLVEAWKLVTTGRPGRKLVELGMVGGIRAVETTFSKRTGWHVHLHCVLIVQADNPIEVATTLRRRWLAAVESIGGSSHHAGQKLELLRPKDAEGWSAYVLKTWCRGTALETLMAPHKGRAAGLTIAEIATMARDGDMHMNMRWDEYEAGSKGKHQVAWYRLKALKETYGDAAEPTDEEDAIEPPEELPDREWNVSPSTWYAIALYGDLGTLCTLMHNGTLDDCTYITRRRLETLAVCSAADFERAARRHRARSGRDGPAGDG